MNFLANKKKDDILDAYQTKKPDTSFMEMETMQRRIHELEEVHDSYDQVVSAFTEGFIMDISKNDIIKKLDKVTLEKWFSNPDDNMKNITTLLSYYYVSDGDMFQLYDLIFSLPDLDYKITVLDKDKQSEEDLNMIKLFLERRVKHKNLTRDLAIQLASKGTILGTWIGNKKNLYFHTFDDLEFIYPYGRMNGDMIGVIDLKWLNNKKELEQEQIFDNLESFISREMYDRYKTNNDIEKDRELRYVTLPPERSLVERIHTLNRNQRLGIPFGTQALFDIQHKQKMKDLEVAIANKIIRAITVLKFKGKDDNGARVHNSDKKKVVMGVRNALDKMGDSDGITMLAIPDFADLQNLELKNGESALHPAKYENINNDISAAMGISGAMTNGTGSNFSSANLSLDILYKKIGVILEKIEVIYNQLIDLVLGKRGENYIFEYNTERPLSRKERLDILLKLQSQGYSTKAVVDEIGGGIRFEEYFEQSIFEIEEMEARDRIIPPLTSYTITNDDSSGRPEVEGGENENTDASKSSGGNNNPETDE